MLKPELFTYLALCPHLLWSKNNILENLINVSTILEMFLENISEL